MGLEAKQSPTRGSRPRLAAPNPAMTIDQLERALLELPAHERARLAERLIASLEEESEAERAWYAEAERRLEEIQAGSVREVPADEVYGSLR
jgi:putative addiction module component (TIGR02574 family)